MQMCTVSSVCRCAQSVAVYADVHSPSVATYVLAVGFSAVIAITEN